MQGMDLKDLRKVHGLKQGEAADLVGISGAYLGELERDEKPIDSRMAQRINTALRTRIDVSYSLALGGWTVTVVRPVPVGADGRIGRQHEVVGRYDDRDQAQRVADGLREKSGFRARVIVHREPDGPLNTTNPSGL